MIATSRQWGNIGAAIIGNTLEWFDILVYAYFVRAIATNFFPATDSATSLLLAYGTFGISFVARPLGAVVLGRIADRSGRRVAMVYASVLMFVGTIGIAALPNYARIGIAAPVFLLAARLVQGFSVGGEFGSAAAYLAEQSSRHRAFLSSLQFASQGFGMIGAAAVGLALGAALSPEQLGGWGWRIPFAIGAAFGPLAYRLRSRADETSDFIAPSERPAVGVANDSRDFALRCVIGIGLVMACTVAIYLLVYLPTFAQTVLRAPPLVAYTVPLLSGVALLIGSAGAGALADRIGVRRIALIGATALVVLPVPVLTLMVARGGEATLLAGVVVLSLATSCYLGALPALLADLFAPARRSLGIAISYNVAVMSGGGFAQAIFVLVTGWTRSAAGPGYYLVAAATVSLAALLAQGRRRAAVPSLATSIATR